MKRILFIKPVPLFLTFLVIVITGFSALCDVVSLKSGGKITGIIISEDSSVIAIDLGFGTTSVDTADIIAIKRSDANGQAEIQKQWKKQYYSDDRFLPPILKPLVNRVSRLRALRNLAVKRKRVLDRLSDEIDSLEQAIAANTNGYIALHEDLRNVSQKGIRQQYQLVGKAHEMNTSILECQQQLKGKKRDRENGNRALIEYMDSLAYFNRFFIRHKKSYLDTVPKDAHSVLVGIEKDFQNFNAEFEIAAIDVTFTSGNHIVVPVTINEKNPVSLLLDTGASSVTLSRPLAVQLGINWNNGRKVKVTLANGEKVDGHAVHLRSVAVEDFRATDVRAIVLEKPPGPGIDGLLGMSYLDRFVINIDAVNKKLVLKHFTAR